TCNSGNTTTSSTMTITVNNATPPTADITAPSVPTGLACSSQTTSSISLSWNASTDPVVSGATTSGVASYDIFRNGTYITTVSSGLTYTDNNNAAGLTPGTSYAYTIRSTDNANNDSSQSSPAL